jgi:uncharacterized membrane protein YdjX (TVP38/TMEM64 family)
VQQALALCVVAAGVFAFYWVNFRAHVPHQPEALRDFVADLGLFGPLALISVMTLRPFLGLPSWLVMLASGMLFGPLLGTLYAVLGGLGGALLIFGVARALGRETVQARLGLGALRSFEEYLARRGATWLALYVAVPVTWLTPVFAGAGLSRMRLPTFAAGTGLGFVPRAGLFAVAGRAATDPTLANLALALAAAAVAALVTVWSRQHLSRARAAPSEARKRRSGAQ